jgi:hypothetical protein
MLFDRDGNRMTPTHAVKKDTRYHYYLSRPLITKHQTKRSTRLRIPTVEPVRHRQTKGAATDMFGITATAPHSDSTNPAHSSITRVLALQRRFRTHRFVPGIRWRVSPKAPSALSLSPCAYVSRRRPKSTAFDQASTKGCNFG